MSIALSLLWIAAASAATAPASLSLTGLFKDTASLTPAQGVVAYDVNMPLWSDGARKQRWLRLPARGKIRFSPTGSWTFPEGSVLVKHFDLETAPGRWTRLETRMLTLTRGSWNGVTYVWNDDQRDAKLIDAGVDRVFSIQDASGVKREQTWRFPSRGECLRCHTQPSGGALGVRTRQLNRDGQLGDWNRRGFFLSDIGDETRYEAYPRSDARAYLAVNCSHCHMPGGTVPFPLDLRYDATDLHAIGVRPVSDDLGLADPFIIKAGDHASSVLWKRMTLVDSEDRMPAVGSRVVDETGVELVRQWIDQMR